MLREDIGNDRIEAPDGEVYFVSTVGINAEYETVVFNKDGKPLGRKVHTARELRGYQYKVRDKHREIVDGITDGTLDPIKLT